MAQYDPETLIILRRALDEAWADLSDGSKSQTLKSEIAQRVLKLAARTQSNSSFCLVSARHRI